MSLIKNQLRMANERIAACETLAANIGDEGSDYLHLGWLKEDLVAARSFLAQIDPEIVQAFRRQKKPTDEVLDKHVDHAAYKFQADTSGVFACLDSLTDRFGSERNAVAVLNVEKIRKPARKIVRTLHLMTRPKLAFLLSWRCLFLIILIGLVASCLLYVTHYAIHTDSGLSAAQSVTSSAAIDAKKIQEAANDPSGSIIDRSLKTATTIVDLLPKLPKAVLAITATIAAFQTLFAALVGLAKRK
jgi:hypothetical protein